MIGRVRRWLGGPAAEIRELERAVRKLADAQRTASAQVEGRLADLSGQIANRASAKDATEIFHAIRALVAGLDRDGDARVFKALDVAARGTGPILVGPWTGEVGFEVLYWIPFLDWFRTRWRIDERRFVIVSRGGVSSWYGMPGAAYVDVLTTVTPEAFRAQTDQEEHKQRGITAFEQTLLDAVVAGRGLTGATHLHPSLLYRTLGPFWRDDAGFGLVERFSSHRRLVPPVAPELGALPPDYVAVRFYFNDCFPDTPANRDLARATIAELARRSPVVLLNPGIRLDDHEDFGPEARDSVHVLGGPLAPDRNLAVQSAALSRARAFVGTYGGYSYLAPFYGVPAVGVYSAQTFKQHHLYAARRIFERLGTATVTPVDARDAPLLHAATARQQPPFRRDR